MKGIIVNATETDGSVSQVEVEQLYDNVLWDYTAVRDGISTIQRKKTVAGLMPGKHQKAICTSFCYMDMVQVSRPMTLVNKQDSKTFDERVKG
jgi:hypothetical protein